MRADGKAETRWDAGSQKTLPLTCAGIRARGPDAEGSFADEDARFMVSLQSGPCLLPAREDGMGFLFWRAD